MKACLYIGLILTGIMFCFISPGFDIDISASSEKWQILVNGNTLSGWQAQDPSKPHEWTIAKAVKVNPQDNRLFEIESGQGMFVNGKTGKTQNLVTQKYFSDIEAHIEFNVPHKSNSGVFFMGLYELQVQDDYGRKDLVFSMCGGFYARKIGGYYSSSKEWVGGTPPKVNACKPPGIWQTFDVKFKAPRFNSEGKKIQNALFLEVRQNGILIHHNVEMPGPNSAHMPTPEAPMGPLMLQGDHGPVAYRNVRIRPLH